MTDDTLDHADEAPAGQGGARGADGQDAPGPKIIDERFERRIVMTVPDRHNAKLRKIMARVNADDDLYALWIASNVNAVERLNMSDHGPVHVKIVMNMAVRMLRLLDDAGIVPGVIADYGMSVQDAEVVVALGALLHDIGISIHRDDHESFSLFLAESKLRQILPEVYGPREEAIVRSEVLHTIISHRSGGRPLTIEAGVVRIADSLDMAKGRSRIPFEAGSLSIHSVSAAAVESVSIDAGAEQPIRITVELSNSAGLFQLDQLLREKLGGSGLEPYLEIQAKLGEEEKRLLTDFRL
ncbi:MAG: HD domain-containing protein [Gemmatimonadota bacterium]|nr:HD domain-containing protein [Gemmatimonadota bacterium]